MNSAYGYALALLIGASGAWYVQAKRWDAEVGRQHVEVAANASKATADIAAAQAATETIRQTFVDYKAGSNREITKLESDVRTGAVRLRIAARCPAVPATGADAGGITGGTAELDSSTQSDYLQLRRGLDEQYGLLQFCRAELMKRSAP